MKTATLAAVLVLGHGVVTHAHAQIRLSEDLREDTVALSISAAVRRALGDSEEVRLAQSQVELADAQVRVARSAALPQINGTFGYTRTIESAFGGGGGTFELPDSLRFEPDSTASVQQRLRYLERNTPSAGLGALGSLFGDLPFGQENVYALQFSGSQLLYSGGRVGAANRIAKSFREAANQQLIEDQAEIELQVRTAYYQALLAAEMERISRAGLAQAEAFLAQEQLRRDAGRASDLEVLRAEVSRDNLRPQLVEARNAAALALLNLKRLTNVPLTQSIRLETPLDVPQAAELRDPELVPEVRTAQRAAVNAAEQQVAIREQQVRIARGAFLPNVSLSVNYGRQLLPQQAFDFSGDWRTDFSAGVAVQIPIFNGGQRIAEVRQAQTELNQARLQLDQLRESVQLQYEQARGERQRSRSEIATRQSTVAAADRVYNLTVLRYEEGLATQLEVSQSRLELLQARSNLAQAVAGFFIADAGLVRASGSATDAAAAAPR